MMFLLTLLLVSTLHPPTDGASDILHKGCLLHKELLLCLKELPHVEDLNNQHIQSLLIRELPEGTWLSSEEAQLIGSEIEKIEILNSFIDRVETGYFAKVSGKNKLKRLILRNVQGSAVVNTNMLQGLEKSLNYLVVTNGLTVNIADLAQMEKLADIQLINTKVVGTAADFERLLPNLHSLEIKKCNLEQFPWEVLAKWVADKDPRRLKINDNKWICDCSMVKLKRPQPAILEGELQKVICEGPPNVAKRKLSELTEKDLCPESESQSNSGDVKPSNATGVIGGSSGNDDFGVGSANAQQPAGGEGEKKKTVGIEVIIIGAVTAVLVLAFIIFIVVYKCRLCPGKKNREERTSKTHQNKRYVNVIEEPPLQQYGNNSRAKENGKYANTEPI